MIDYRMIKESQEMLTTWWGDAGKRVIEACARVTPLNVDSKEFLDHCTTCGGNWGGMLLTGIQKLFPEVYDAIPDDMGVMAWGCICSTLILCGVDTSK